MSRWCILPLLIYCVLCDPEIKQLPNCKEAEEKTKRSLLYVSTLDGKLSALDLSRNGEKKWTVDFLQTPLLSSSIDRRDLNVNGQWVRVIPSLKGGLYKFDGETLEALPVSVDQLLSSSFRYSDDLIFSGGQETKTYVIATSSGKIIKQCEMKECNNSINGGNITEEDTLIIHHLHRTVRASELRTGVERWNFSVGQHDLTLVPPENSSCHHKRAVDLDLDIRAIIPEGLVIAYSKKTKLWEHKFDSPIVSVWREDQVEVNTITPLKKVNIFDYPSLDTEVDSDFTRHPSIYVGMHDRQLYVQENPFFQKKIEYSSELELTKYPWKPYPAIESSKENENSEVSKDASQELSELHSATALSVLYNSEFINGYGFYLYSKEQVELDEEKQCNGTGPQHDSENKSESKSTENSNESPTQVFVYHADIWYWWKEIMLIVGTSLTLYHIIPNFLPGACKETTRIVELVPIHVGVVENNKTDNSREKGKPQVENDSNFSSNSSAPFQSYFSNTFKPLKILGKGGYGIVFKVQHRTDHAFYAIKRIALPTNKLAQQRMLREAQALAQLQHTHIIRYCNSWIEWVPAGWQEEHDRQWEDDSNYPQTNYTETSDSNTSLHIEVPSDSPSVDIAQDALKLIQHEDDSFVEVEMSPENSSATSEEGSSIKMDQTSSTSNEENIPNVTNNTEDQSIVFEDSVNLKDSSKDESIVFENGSHHSFTNSDSQSHLISKKRKNKNKSKNKIFLYIQMQLCKEKNLKEWLEEKKDRDINYVINMFLDIVDAVDYVHKKKMIHRDLKTSNIFFTLGRKKKSKIVIGDFGLVTCTTKEFDSNVITPCSELDSTSKNIHTAEVGTLFYMAPELQGKFQNYNNKVDIYSLGIILFEMIIPFDTQTERYHVLNNLRSLSFPQGFCQQYPKEYDLLLKMLHKNPGKRPTATQIINEIPRRTVTVSQNDSDQDDFQQSELPESS